MYKSINQYHVVLALEQQWWESPDFLNTIYVQTPKGTNVPLSTFAHFTQGITLHPADAIRKDSSRRRRFRLTSRRVSH